MPTSGSLVLAADAKMLFFLLLLAAGYTVYLLQGRVDDNGGEVGTEEEKEKMSTPSTAWLVDTPGCKIPELPLNDSTIFNLTSFKHPTPECAKVWWTVEGEVKWRGAALVESDIDSLQITGVKGRNFSCCYRPFARPPPDVPDADNKAVYEEQCFPFKHGDQVKDEFVRVECYGNDTKQVYKDFHSFAPLKMHVEERCSDKPRRPDQLSVVVLGIDSVSRLNMHRELPQTMAALSDAGAVPLLGYNKVADNTFPNLMPMLTGLAEDELKKGCPWPGPSHELDACPFVWKRFAAAGFRTVYAEDCPFMATFNRAKVGGFRQQPTDYYPRPFLQRSMNETGHSKKVDIHQCSGPRLTVDTFIDYTKKLAARFTSERWFGFLWSNAVSHDFMTTPHIGDKAFSGFVSSLNLSGTALFVLSDHGMRWGPFRDTYQGWLECCLPGAFVVLPAWFEKRFPKAAENLRQNAAHRLTTPFDVHATLLDLIEPQAELSGESCMKRGISLFSKIPAGRTCDQAGIAETFCACQDSSSMKTEDVPKAACNAIVASVNAALKNSSGCAVLTLKSVLSARLNTNNRMQLTVQTQPGNAHFQATVTKVGEERYSVLGPVTRLNFYGNSSWCVESYSLKPLCFCE